MKMQFLKPKWKMVKFGEVVKNVNLVERDPRAAGIKRIVGLEHIEPDNLHIYRWNSPEDGTSFTRKFLPKQTLFGKRRAYQRKVAYAEFEGLCSGDILTFESKNKKILLPELLPFICRTQVFFNYALGTSAGSLSPRTSWSALKEFEFLLPPLEEQKQIAEILWAADDVIVSFENVLKNHNIFIRCEVERILESLDCNEMGLLETLSRSPESGCSAPPSPSETGHWVLSLSALSADGYRLGNLKPVVKTTEMLKACLRKGDLLLSRSNTAELVGFAGIFNEERVDVSYPDTMMRLSVNKKLILPEFLEIVLLSNSGRKHMLKTASGTSNSMKKINRKTLSEFYFPVPSIEVQKNIVKNISHYKEQRELIVNHIRNTRNLLSMLLNQGDSITDV